MRSAASLDLLRPSFQHLTRLTDGPGLFEHALHDLPRIEHGYCVDDVARALVVVTREPERSPELDALAEVYLGFLENAVVSDGLVHNRMDLSGRWTDEATIGDWWGRALAALGFTAAHATTPFHRTRGLYAFLRAAKRRSPDVRASAFAALGAAEVVRAYPEADAARRLLSVSLDRIPRAAVAGWEWPEPRLRYANATLCEALIFGGSVLGDPSAVDRGLDLLDFLLTTETSAVGHLSVTGSLGRAPGETGPLWDQQGIEPAAIADACLRAHDVTADPRWLRGVRLAWGWFAGDNDLAVPMYDAVSGAGYDGLARSGRNENRGAESTLAALGTLQHVRTLDS